MLSGLLALELGLYLDGTQLLFLGVGFDWLEAGHLSRLSRVVQLRKKGETK